MISLRLSPPSTPFLLPFTHLAFLLPFIFPCLSPPPSAAPARCAPPLPFPDSYLFDFFFHDYPTTYRRRASASFFYRDALLDHRLDHVLTYTYVLTTGRAHGRKRDRAIKKGVKGAGRGRKRRTEGCTTMVHDGESGGRGTGRGRRVKGIRGGGW